MARRFFCGDCDELERKGLLTHAQRREWEQALARAGVDASKWASVVAQQRALFQSELEQLIETTRVQQNQMHEQTLQQSDLLAVAAGGLLGALNAWMRPPAPVQPTSAAKPPTLWASAFDAAQASLNVARQRRLLDHLHIHHIIGEESSSEEVLLCINGFMTQGRDPSRNWLAWAEGDPSITAYAVLWEAGDANAWDQFCAHANENMKTSGVAAHDLLTHFTGNPWHKAQDKAEQVGVLLAQVLAAKPSFCRGRKVSVFGHSLGGAVIYAMLQELARLRRDGRVTGSPLIHNAAFFAGAFTFSSQGIHAMHDEVSGRLINVYSRRDEVLNKLFWAIQLQTENAIAAGCAPIEFGRVGKGANVDVSDLVPPRMPNQFGHSYGPHMDSIRARVLPHLTP